jgi:hypothetical protein
VGFHQEFFLGGCSTYSFEDIGQRERRSGGGSPLVRGSTQFANEKPIFLLGCYGFIFHRSWNLAQLQNFGGGFDPLSPRYITAVHCDTFVPVAVLLLNAVLQTWDFVMCLCCFCCHMFLPVAFLLLNALLQPSPGISLSAIVITLWMQKHSVTVLVQYFSTKICCKIL